MSKEYTMTQAEREVFEKVINDHAQGFKNELQQEKDDEVADVRKECIRRLDEICGNGNWDGETVRANVGFVIDDLKSENI